MDFNSLKAFLAVAEEGSFSQAAKVLHLTQPAISKRISALEESLGLKLFDRIGRSVGLSPAGKTLLPKAKNIIQNVDDAKCIIKNLTNDIVGTLKIGASHHIGLYYLPKVLKHFHERYPEVILDLRFMGSEKIHAALQAGHLEIGIATLPPVIDFPLRTLCQWNDELAICVCKDHPLTQVPHLDLSALSQYEAILPDNKTFTYSVIENIFHQKGLELKQGIATNYLETIKMIVGTGLGWSALPSTMIDSRITQLNIEGVHLSRQLGIMVHKNRTLSNAAEIFMKTLSNRVTTQT